MVKKVLLSVAATAFIVSGALAVQSTPAEATWWGKDKGAKSSTKAGWSDYWAKKKAWWDAGWVKKKK